MNDAPMLRLLRFLMRRVLAAEPAELAEFEPFARLLLVLGRAVVAALTVLARQVDDVSHCCIPDELQSSNSKLQVVWSLKFGIWNCSFTRRSPKSCRRRRCGRLHGSRNARPSRVRRACAVPR